MPTYTFAPSRALLVWRRFARSAKVFLIGAESTRPKNKVWEWCRALAIPVAFFAIGSGLMLWEHDTFQVGFCIAYAACGLMAIDLALVTRREHAGSKVFAAIVVALPTLLISWLVFRPAPLGISALASAVNYETGTNIDGIPWAKAYSQVSGTLTNDTAMEYRNVDIYLRVDLIIARATTNGVNDCKSFPSNAPGLLISHPVLSTHENGGGQVFTPNEPPFTTFTRIWCSTLAPHTGVDFTLAVVSDPSAALHSWRGDRSPRANWLAFKAQYEAGNKDRNQFSNMCLSRSDCRSDMPESPTDVSFLRGEYDVRVPLTKQ